jgi:uncharacterized protein (TIGR02687 family)
VRVHAEFYQAIKRKELLKRLLKADDTFGMIRLKMLAVCAGSEPRLDAILECLLQELMGEEPRTDTNRHETGGKFRLIVRCKLEGYLWEQLKRCYGYESSEPSIHDFIIQIFKDAYFQNFDLSKENTKGVNSSHLVVQQRLTGDALVFLKRWKDSRQFEAGFETLSAECVDILGIEHDLDKRDFRELIELDYFRLIDQKIISDLVNSVALRTITSGDVALLVRQRRQSHWYKEYRHLYGAIDFAAQFFQALSDVNLTMGSFVEGIERYSRFWFRLDQLYRKFTYHVRLSGQATLMGSLTEQVENFYSNNYLLKLNDQWQAFVDTGKQWDATPVLLQRNFYERCVKPFLNYF